MGVFATRSPHRPNPIGLSLVKIKKVHSDRIEIDGVDLVDGTPVIDIKPYLPEYEIRPEAKAGWVDETLMKQIKVDFTPIAAAQLEEWVRKSGRNELRQVISDILIQDPRPVIYRGCEDSGGKYRQNHVFRLYEKDIHFKFVTGENVVVTEIKEYLATK
jgi:tRNA (adenine37-N6)-methyltransferase